MVKDNLMSVFGHRLTGDIILVQRGAGELINFARIKIFYQVASSA